MAKVPWDSVRCRPRTLILCRAMIKGLRNNPCFPNLPISLDDFGTRVNVLAAALVAAQDGGKTALAARDEAVADLIPDLRLILVYCETVAKGDPEMLTSANIPIVSKSPGPTGDPFIRKIWRGDHPGEIAMFVKAGENADCYVIRHGVDGTDRIRGPKPGSQTSNRQLSLAA